MSETLTFRTPDPLPHQRAFWADMTPDADVAIVGPQGCGKTLALAVKLALLSALNAPYPGILVTPTLGLFRKIHEREWPLLLQECGVHVEIRGGNDPQITWPWGSVTHVFSGDAPQRIVGVNAAYAGIDEPAQMDREVYERTKSRLREPRAKIRQLALTGTPEGLNWFSDLFADPTPPRRTIWASTWHESVAHYRDNLRQTYGYDEALFATYAKGQFVPLHTGRAYAKFDRAKHVRGIAYEASLGEVQIWCDFNVHAMRWQIAQALPRELRVLDEIALGRAMDTEVAARETVRRLQALRHKGRVVICGDASGAARRSSSTRTDYQIIHDTIRAAGYEAILRVPAANPAVKERVQAVNWHFAGQCGRSVVIDPQCRELILDLERVTWRTGAEEIDKSDPERTHASDAFGYGVWVNDRPRAASVPMPVAPQLVEQHMARVAAGREW